MFHLLMIALVGATPVADVPTYEEQVSQCEAAIQASPYPIGSQGQAATRQACREMEGVALERETGSLIAAGRCDDAIALALKAGALQLAANIRTYCSGAPRNSK